jgi:protein O-mannosyl-transferase
VVFSYFTQKNIEAVSDYPSFVIRLCVPFYGMIFYIVKTIVPVHLSALYPLPLQPDRGMKALIYLSPFLVAGIGCAVYYSRRYSRKVIFGTLFFLFTLLPVLQIVPVGSFAVAERYTYLSLIGVYLLFAEGLAYILREKIRNKGPAKSALLAGLVILLFTCGCMTYARCGVWKDSLTLWNDALSNYPSAIGYNNRATAYGELGRTDEALLDYSRAIHCDPMFAKAYNNRGIAYLTKGNAGLALADFDRTIDLRHDYYDAYNNRGIIYVCNNEFEKAIADFTRALALKPDYAPAYANRGIAYMKKGALDLAVRDFDKAIAFDPADHTSREKRRQALADLQNTQKVP